MKRINTIITILIISFSSLLEAQEVPSAPLTVAVLDSQLAEGIPYNISPLTANYVSDTLLRLGKFNVIPRSEIYFGWVGAPSPEIDINHFLGRGDYAQLGRQLQADIICLLKVEKRGGDYRLAGELIQADSGVILSSEQTESTGLLGLIDASKLMGEKLSGSQLSRGEKKTPVLLPAAPSAAVQEPAPRQDTEKAPAKSASASSASDNGGKKQIGESSGNNKKTTPFGSFTFGIIFPEFTGSAKSTLEEDNQLHVLYGSVADISGGVLIYDLGLNINIRIAGDSLFCLDLGMNLNWEWIEYEKYYTYTVDEGENFIFMDFYLGPGIVLPMGKYFQAAAGFTLGYGMLEPNYSLWDGGSEIAGGLTLGYNIGIEARTPGGYVLTLKYMAVLASELDKTGLVDNDVIYVGNTDFGFSGIQIGIGTTL